MLLRLGYEGRIQVGIRGSDTPKIWPILRHSQKNVLTNTVNIHFLGNQQTTYWQKVKDQKSKKKPERESWKKEFYLIKISSTNSSKHKTSSPTRSREKQKFRSRKDGGPAMLLLSPEKTASSPTLSAHANWLDSPSLIKTPTIELLI